MKKIYIILLAIVAIVVILLVLNTYLERGTFEEIVFNKYVENDVFTYMEIKGDEGERSTEDQEKIEELISYLNNVKLKERSYRLVAEDNKHLRVNLSNKGRSEVLYIVIDKINVNIIYKTTSLEYKGEELRKEYKITDKDFDIEKIQEIYDSL
ncbi:hypothetical protein GOQ27_07560 [Clostridium sp. D2Q-11]|uniref:Uncharacterized protein n=1 Tax=Anaeromonas frigoriresistens TaxID=2683708 RepID=A0A942UWR4_9FIRM|nr:hypothetical protein [Anaeromonas frigoriresistens]MBS4538316.1 hypothetical protein [Anaeromonas frigoriresistens]